MFPTRSSKHLLEPAAVKIHDLSSGVVRFALAIVAGLFVLALASAFVE